jgi:hypothetical protein
MCKLLLFLTLTNLANNTTATKIKAVMAISLSMQRSPFLRTQPNDAYIIVFLLFNT